MKIPFVDLKANYLSIKEEIDSAIAHVIEKTAFISGPFVEEFEENFAKKIGAKYCVGVSSGTSALQIALLAHKKQSVITTSNTFIATAESAESIRGCSIESFVDVDENGLVSIKALETKIWPGCNFCVIPVHLYGQVVDIDTIKKKFNSDVCIIEDAAQCHFGRYKDDTYVGSKNTSCFSFFPGKRLGCYGDGGAITTNDEKIYEYAKAYRDHGRKSKYESEIIGTNARLDGIQAAILSTKLNHVLDWNDKCRKIAKKYNNFLQTKNIPIKTPDYNEQYIYHLYVIREMSGRRDELKKYLESAEIQCGIHYKIPIHKQKAFDWAKEQSLPITEMLCSEILSLPIWPELSDEQIEYTCSKINEFYNV
jgi:dTDP-4-amino-4,6-dideoxygalactose transaminase